MALDPSTVRKSNWAEDYVTDALKPSENEVLIEDWRNCRE